MQPQSEFEKEIADLIVECLNLEDIDAAESHVFARHVHGRIARIYQLKREVVEFKRAVLPLREPLHQLVEQGEIPAGLEHYFSDVTGRLACTARR